MSSANGDAFGNSASASRATWSDFCEHHAASAAEEFAWHVGQYLQDNPMNSGCDFGEKYAEFFLLHFDAQTLPKRPAIVGSTSSISASPFASPSKSPRRDMVRSRPMGLSCRSHTVDTTSTSSSAAAAASDGSLVMDHVGRSKELDGNSADQDLVSPTKHRSFFRKFSIRGIRNNMKPLRQLFRQHSDEMELSNSNLNDDSSANGKLQTKSRHDKTKMTKMLVECKKEGIVNKLVDDDASGKTKWEKCRLLLIKTVGGDLLEFYIPPKVMSSHL